MKLKPYNKHIKKLIEQGFSDREIQTEIRKVFNKPFKISDIQNKRTNELINLIKPFREDSIELLYPILYKGFPDRNFIKDKLDQIFNYLIDEIKTVKGFSSENVLIDLLLIFEEGLNTYKHDAFLYRLIYQHKTKNTKELEDSRAIQQLKAQIADPFKYYFSLSNISIQHQSFREDSSEFDSIIREVCRDNIVTEKERAYLEEKAAEYFINPDKLKIYLDNPFLGHETFKIFIDQICEDGVVTDTELQYINEKAKQYNVPSHILEKMISAGILRSQFAEGLSLDDNFYEIVLIFLFANVYNIKTIQQKLSDLLIDQPDNKKVTNQLEIKKIDLFNLLQEAVLLKPELKTIHTHNPKNIFELYSVINIEILEFSNIRQTNNTVKEPLDDIKMDCETYHLDGYTFVVETVKQDLAPLFWSKTEGLRQYIYVNETHPKYKLYSNDSFKQVLIALGRSSLSFADNSGELFFNRMKNYIELIK
jgi:hypothetical protein